MKTNSLPYRRTRSLFFATMLISITISSCSKNQPEDQTPAPTDNKQPAAYRVSESEAKHVAEDIALSAEVYAQYRHSKETRDTQRIFKGLQRVLNLTPVIAGDGQPAFYVCNFQQGGFALVAADRHMRPLLAFAEHGSFSYPASTSENSAAANKGTTTTASVLPDGLLTWVETTKAASVALRQNPSVKNAVPGAAAAWQALDAPICPITGDPAVDFACANQPNVTTTQRGPLLSTAWGQDAPYNAKCFSSSGAQCPTGCVATAMAQILRYWQRPTRYQWAAMPTGSLYPWSGSFPELAQLMKDIGEKNTGVSMDYTPSGSGADSREVCPTFKNTFGYGSADYRGYPNGSSGTSLPTLLTADCSYTDVQSNFDRGQPVMLGGFTDQHSFLWVKWPATTGHTWVSDGYLETHFLDTGTTFLDFHMDWGWNGDYTGWYYFNNWNITFSDGSTRNYQYCQDAVINIRP